MSKPKTTKNTQEVFLLNNAQCLEMILCAPTEGNKMFYWFDERESRTFETQKIILSFIMPVENLEEQGLEKNPNLELAQWKYLLTTDKYKNDTKIKTNLLKAIETDSKYNSYVSECVK